MKIEFDVCCIKMVRLVRVGQVRPLIEGIDDRDGVIVNRISYTHWRFCPFCGSETNVTMMGLSVMQ